MSKSRTEAPATAVLLATLFCALSASRSGAADTAAKVNGNWSSAATWTNGVPTATVNAYIGSISFPGAAATATVTLTQNSAANSVGLSDSDPSTHGTLDLSGFMLSANSLTIGATLFSGGSGIIARTGGGTLSISSSISVGNGSEFSFATADVTPFLAAGNGTVTTAATGNVTVNAMVSGGGVLALGADLNLSNNRYLQNGTLNANGHAISAGSVFLGVNNGPFALNNRGTITTFSLAVSSAHTPGLTNFNLTAADNVTSFGLTGVSTVLPAGVVVQSLNLTRLFFGTLQLQGSRVATFGLRSR